MAGRAIWTGIGSTRETPDDGEPYLHLVDSAAAAPFEFRERRYHPSSGPGVPTVVCRVCFTRPVLAVERIEVSEGRAYHRCPECGGVSLIRFGDAVLIGAPPDYLEVLDDND